MLSNTREFAIACPTIFDGEQFLQDHCVIVRGESIAQVIPAAQCPTGIERVTLPGGTLAPGLIDLQVNGGGGLMLQNARDTSAIETVLAAHRALGTTSMLPTLLSDTLNTQQSIVQAIEAAMARDNPGILGVHIEGPFFNDARRGAHRQDCIRQINDADIAWLCGLQHLTLLLTLAPEEVPLAYIEQLARSGAVVCAGHTNASYQQIATAAAQGLQGVTHLYNAMRPATAREPGTVGAALHLDTLWAGIIADGHHVHPANIQLAHAAKPAGKLLLVSDAMATVGSDKTCFELYGEEICAKDGRLVNSDGVLAGSAISLMDAVRYTHRELGLALQECLRMASLYPATVLGLDDTLGRIVQGQRADLVHFNTDFAVHNTWLAGQHLAHADWQ